MSAIKNMIQNLLKDESAQGAAEYVLLLVVVVALVVAFKGKIMSAFSSKVDGLGQSIQSFSGDN